MGHITVLYMQRKKADKLIISFNGIGLVHTCLFSFQQEFLFLIAGITVNLFFVIIDVCKEINLSLLILNLLPIYPLDGGRLFKLLLNKVLALNISDTIFRFVSAFFMIAVILISIYFQNLNLLLISIYSIVYSINNSID